MGTNDQQLLTWVPEQDDFFQERLQGHREECRSGNPDGRGKMAPPGHQTALSFLQAGAGEKAR